jgi:hypothetical protein
MRDIFALRAAAAHRRVKSGGVGNDKRASKAIGDVSAARIFGQQTRDARKAICGSGNRRKNNNSASSSPAKAYQLAAWLHGGKRLAALAASI